MSCLAPWRHHWASADLSTLRRFYPELLAEHQLPLPTCMQGNPTVVPPVLVPMVHMLLAMTDVVLLPMVLLVWIYAAKATTRTPEAPQLRLVRPRLTSKRQVPEQAIAGVRALLCAWMEAVLATFAHRARALQYLSLLHYALLGCVYVVLSTSGYCWVALCLLKPMLSTAPLVCVGLFALYTLPMPVVAMKLISKAKSFCTRAPMEMSEIRAYHATAAENEESIRHNGFRVSTQGMLGRGVYISRDLNKVWGYGGQNGVIFELRVRVGKICTIDRQLHPKQNTWSDEADMAYVPYRCGMVASGLEEACVAKVAQIKVVRTWPKRGLAILLVYDLLRSLLDQLAWLYCFPCILPGYWVPTIAPQAKSLEPPDLEDLSNSKGDQYWRQEWLHATVPPALAHSLAR